MIFSDPFNQNCPRIYRFAPSPFPKNYTVLEIGYNKVPSGLRQVRKRNVYILHYVINGAGNICGEDFEAGYCYTVFPNQLESITADKENPYETYWIMLEGEKLDEIFKKCNFSIKNGSFKFNRTKECAEILKNTLFNINPSNEIEEACLLQSAFFQIMAEHFKEYNGKPQLNNKAQKVKDYIDRNYHERISVDNISKIFNFSRNYLFLIFKKEYGISPQTYLNDIRIEKSKELLLDEKQLPINEIAFAVGFNDPLYFSRLFSKKIGISPKEYRKQNINSKKTEGM